MKTSIMVFGVVMAQIAAWQFAQAQGTLYVSNLGQTPTRSAAIGSDSWIAQGILTGTNPGGYLLNSIQLLMDPATGSPNGFTVSVFDYEGVDIAPGVSLGNLSGPDPAAGGIFSYTVSSQQLSRSTYYYVVVTAATPTTQGAYVWSARDTFLVNGAEGWQIDNGYASSSDGLNWTVHDRNKVFQLAIYATPVPEPSTLALAALGLAALSFWRFRQRKSCQSQ